MYPRTLSLPDALFPCRRRRRRRRRSRQSLVGVVQNFLCAPSSSAAFSVCFQPPPDRRPAARRGKRRGFVKAPPLPTRETRVESRRVVARGKKVCNGVPSRDQNPGLDRYVQCTVQRLEWNEDEFETRFFAPLGRCTTAPTILYENVIARGH